MANTDPRNGEELGAPIFQATVAAAMEYEVEVVCTATSGRLMKKGVAEKLVVKEGSPKTVYDLHQGCPRRGREVHVLLAQSGPFRHVEGRPDPECTDIVGGAYLIEQIMEEDDTRVLTY